MARRDVRGEGGGQTRLRTATARRGGRGERVARRVLKGVVHDVSTMREDKPATVPLIYRRGSFLVVSRGGRVLVSARAVAR